MLSVRKDLEQKGYVVLDRVLSEERCDQLREHANELVEHYQENQDRTIFSTHSNQQARNQYFIDSCDKIHFFWEEGAFDKSGELIYPKIKAINKIGHGLHIHDEIFRNFSKQSLFSEVVQESGYFEQPKVSQSMYIFKQPKIGGEVLCHQDSTFIHTSPDKVLGLWVALEESHEENGCLWGIPGQYTEKPFQIFKKTEKGCVFEPEEGQNYALEKAVPLPVKKGSVILFHGLFPHFSYENRSKESRHAFTLHYIDKKNRYLESNWNQSKHLLS